MLIMLVFDPLAVLLLIAANMSMKKPEETQPVKKTWNDFFEKEPIPDDKVEVEKENIASIEEEVIGETIPPLRVQVAPGVYTEHHDEESKKKLQPKYDYDAEYAFKEKNNLNGGNF